MRSVFLLQLLWLSLSYGDDRLRPQYHLMPVQNWLNDPNGPFFFNGYYHMFYQHNPNAPVWGDMHWGHCYSKDMVHWIHLPIALAPDQTYDRNGVFTGSTTMVDGIPTIIYTGITTSNQQVQCLARPVNVSDPTLTNWTKISENPLISEPNGRDPSTAFQDSSKNFYLIYGYGDKDLGGQAVVFTSKDFLNWTYLHPIHGNHYDSFWECPDIFNISDRYVLKASLLGRDFWTVGLLDWNQIRFFPSRYDLGEYVQLVDFGKFYASKTFYDPINVQQVLFGWISEDDNLGPQRGWQGLHSLPRKIFLSEDRLEIRTRPIDAVTSLRNVSSHQQLRNISFSSIVPFQLIPNIRGNQAEIQVDWSFPANQVLRSESNLDFGLAVLLTPDGTQRTNIGIRTRTETNVMFNTDLPGWDYFSVPAVNQWADCQQACNEDAICQSWTFVEDRAIDNNCFLKSGIPLLNANNVCISGVKERVIWVYVNRTLSQNNPNAAHGSVHAPVRITDDSETKLQLQIFIDHSVIEIFEAQMGSFALTTRVYPEQENAEFFSFYVEDSPSFNQTIVLNSLDFWTLENIWNSNKN